MKIKTAIRRIREYGAGGGLRTPADFAWAGVPLEKKSLGDGAFREVFKVKDCPLVVKFPLSECGYESDDGIPRDYSSGIRHSAIEMKKIVRLRRFKWMRRFLPEVYYYDRKHGIIVMRHYEGMDGADFESAGAHFVKMLIKKATGVTIADYGDCNVGLRGNKLILLDLGY